MRLSAYLACRISTQRGIRFLIPIALWPTHNERLIGSRWARLADFSRFNSVLKPLGFGNTRNRRRANGDLLLRGRYRAG